MRQVFVGDKSGMVDQLIASCQVKAPAGSNYQGYGRDLVPFDFEQQDLAPGKPCMMGPLEDGKNKARRGSPKSYKVVTKKVQHILSKAEPQQQQAQSRSPRRQAKKQADEESYPTAPGFSQSPKPEAVPLPTMFLMRKALAKSVELCKAVTHEQTLASLTAVRVAAV